MHYLLFIQIFVQLFYRSSIIDLIKIIYITIKSTKIYFNTGTDLQKQNNSIY